VIENLHRFVIKPVYRAFNSVSIFGSLLSQAERNTLRDQILAHPRRYVGQEQVSFSTTPCLIKGRIEPRPAAIRTFITSADGTYHVMKGGLARAARDRGITAPSRHLDHVNKDTWVITDKPERHVSLWLQPSSEELDLERSGILASRAAENLFWTGRYAERTEGAARLVRTVIQQMNQAEDSHDHAYQQHLAILQHAVTSVTETFPGFHVKTSLTGDAVAAELRAVMNDAERAGTIAHSLRALINAALMVRDRWSLDNWRVLDSIKNQWQHVQAHQHRHVMAAHYELDELITSLAAFTGLNMESMTREPGWLMLDSGRRIERAMWLIRLTKSLLITAYDENLEHLVLESFLSMNESLITHRRRYRSYLQLQTVLDVLLTDESNPRALAYQVARLQRNLARMPRPRLAQKLSEEERYVLEATTQLRLAEPSDLAARDPEHGHANLRTFIDAVETRLMGISKALDHYYFTHAQGARQLAPTRRNAEPI
jgi:uncharacterized alpha-E superfamily protein